MEPTPFGRHRPACGCPRPAEALTERGAAHLEASATRQLDFVFASRSIANRIQVAVRNGVEEWGPSDHCCLEITVNPKAR
jgi:hypothetical protein